VYSKPQIEPLRRSRQGWDAGRDAKIVLQGASALAAAIGLTTIPAIANDLQIQQFGWANSAGGAQSGFMNRIGIYQNGRWHRVISQQFGNHNLAAVGQCCGSERLERWRRKADLAK
jgi:hypothetical protein